MPGRGFARAVPNAPRRPSRGTRSGVIRKPDPGGLGSLLAFTIIVTLLSMWGFARTQGLLP